MDSIQKGNFTMRILKDQLQNILKMGPVGQVMGMIPGFANNMMPKVIFISQMTIPTVIMSGSDSNGHIGCSQGISKLHMFEPRLATS